MIFPNQYKALSKNIFKSQEYQIVPIRYKDRLNIMKWRNEQIYHLRQSELLTEESQERYFQDIVSKLFNQKEPDQLLFSFLKNDKIIGYGGLVHINWTDKNAEISFIMDTNEEKKYFYKYWTLFLNLIEELSFKIIGLHKIYVYAFDLRPHLYTVLEKNKFNKEAVLQEQCLFNGKFIDVLIYEKRYQQ